MEPNDHPATLGNGRYAIQRRLGAGGEGSVFLAYDSVLSRWVAIKQIHSTAEKKPPLVETAAIREATHLARLQHPNIITVYDIASSEEEVLVVMEYLPGQNVDELEDAMDAPFFMDFATQCLRGLAAAHAIGMVHRDIKPGNIMIAGHESGGFQVKILDFGLAKVLEEPTLQTMDQSGALMGSIFMMSPEQLEGHLIDHRTDLYSLGCVFYKALTRLHPFQGKSVPAVAAAHLSHTYEPLATLRPDLPQPLVFWVERLFARAPGDRPQSATAALEGLPSPAKPPRQKSQAKPSLPIDSPLPQKSPTRFSRKKILLIAAGVILLAGAGYWISTIMRDQDPHAKMIAEADTDSASRSSFSWRERDAILRREGQKTTLTGTIEGFEEDSDGRFHLTFKGATARDLTLCFDRSKGDFSALLLKNNIGLGIQATGIVSVDGKRVFLENPTLREFVIPKSSPNSRE